ncbi:MAG TPA: TPM domain-containing protein [Bacteroidota bacterium]|nr:TPM domain-containing protein [Bacteroidota bacterium]
MKTAIVAIALLVQTALTQRLEVPFLSGRVNDYAGILSQQTVRELEAQLEAHERATSNQVAVLIIPSLQGEVLEEYSMRVVETWKLGQKEKDNGVLLLIARDDRQLRIEVGDGLEGDLTDAVCSQIIRNEIVPHFKDGDYDAGVRAGVNAILGTIEGSYTVSEEDIDSSGEMDLEGRILMGGMFLLVVGIFTVIAIVSPGFQGWFLYFFLMPFWFAFPYAVIGVFPWGFLPFALYAVVLPILRILFQRGVKSGGWQKSWATSFASSSRGGWSSGGWSSGGGGFSGGGGSFSGGGSSGRW